MKKKYLIHLILLSFTCLSCQSIKIREIPMVDDTQPFLGDIEKIEMTTHEYRVSNSKIDTVRTESILIFDKKNNLVKQNEKSGKYITETVYDSSQKYFKSRATRYRNNTTNKTNETYDKKGNIIKSEKYSNGILSTSFIYTFDKKGNPIEIIISNPTSPVLKTIIEKRTYNYPSGYFISFEDNEPDYYKIYFDKKGFITKYERFGKNDILIETIMKYEYDSKGNLSRMCMVDNSGKEFYISTFTNMFDSKGNIVAREKYLEGKLIMKTLNKIIYRK